MEYRIENSVAGEVQSSLVWMRRSSSGAGIWDGWGLACGWLMKTFTNWLQGKASAIPLAEPARWTADRIMLNFATLKYKQRIKHMTVGSLPVPVFTIRTTASLSQRHRIDRLAHCAPQIAAAIIMGSNYLTVMWLSLMAAGHCSTLKPYITIECTVASQARGIGYKDYIPLLQHGASIINRPFQCVMKLYHHRISELASMFSLIKPVAGQWWADFIGRRGTGWKCDLGGLSYEWLEFPFIAAF